MPPGLHNYHQDILILKLRATGFVERSSSGQLPQDPLHLHGEKIATAMGTRSRADTPITASEISAVLRRAKQSAPGQDATSYTMM